MYIELIPSAKRLIRSLRDIGYEFVDAVADIVDNSIEAESTAISITLKFEGENSYMTIADNGVGMTSKDIQEALRFGSNRAYESEDDLGRYGLGLKTASLSQCERLTVSSRRGEERVRVNSFCWDLNHIERTNRWEILKIERGSIKEEVLQHLHETTGTVVTWERLGRLLGYKYPSGEFARKQAEQMAESLKLHLGMVFHRFLSGEIHGKRISIYINSERVIAWDPYSRGEKHTQQLNPIMIPLEFNEELFDVKVQPYILPPQAMYSSSKAHLHASGIDKWNKQQGLYIYRSNRIIQSGGWSGLRTSDEHTKLVRIAVFIPSQLDELFQVNVAKKHLSLPRELRNTLLKEIQPIIHRAQEVYRDKLIPIRNDGPTLNQPKKLVDYSEKANALSDSKYINNPIDSSIQLGVNKDLELIEDIAIKIIDKAGFSLEGEKLKNLMRNIFKIAELQERKSLVILLEKFVKCE